jgi:hypothetical protein
MGLNETDIQDVKLARLVAVIDLWDIDDRISHLEEITERLEKVVQCLIALYREERVKNWEMILHEMLKRKEDKKRMIKPIFKVEDTSLLEKSENFP